MRWVSYVLYVLAGLLGATQVAGLFANGMVTWDVVIVAALLGILGVLLDIRALLAA